MVEGRVVEEVEGGWNGGRDDGKRTTNHAPRISRNYPILHLYWKYASLSPSQPVMKVKHRQNIFIII